MNKKDYVSPSVTTEQMDMMKLICASEGITSDIGIDYGGVDEDGTMTVDCRRHTVWDEDEEEGW